MSRWIPVTLELSRKQALIIYPKDSPNYKHWRERYVSAIKTYNELSGMDLKPQEDKG